MKHTLVRRAAAIRTATALGLTASVLAVPGSGLAGAATGDTNPGDIVLGAITLAQAEATTPFPGITRTVYQDADRTWTVNVMDIDPNRAPITFDGSIGQGMYTTQTVQEMLEQTTGVTSRRPYLGVNGGYFDDGVVLDQTARIYLGDLGGTSMKNGRLLSEAGGGRYAYDPVTGKAVGLRPANSVLMLQNGRPYITELGTALTVRLSDDATVSRKVDGVNRLPGRAGHCLRNTDPANTDVTVAGGVCFDPSEIVEFTPEFGARTPAADLLKQTATTTDDDPGVEVLFNAAGVATACFRPGATAGGIVSDAPRGGHDVPPGGRALEGTGDGAAWLWDNACAGRPVSLHTVVTDTRFGDTVADTWFGRAPAGAVERPIDPAMYATPVGDVLIRDATVVYQVPGDTARAWRTAGGADGFGHLFFVTVEGQKGGPAPLAAGATRSELAQLLKALNLVDAVNMDGGGSTTLNLRDQNGSEPPVTTTTDSAPRHVADTVYAAVGGYGLAK
ncbi:phosphodiester glycosidase family protein [Kitasatospora sp. NPDC127116]|uniref:phosphodiester glycosidase family protein n=1 Tax=Kitasatospora sp. NPDC127116 TaxID=3345367 RepID=UPI00363589B6